MGSQPERSGRFPSGNPFCMRQWLGILNIGPDIGWTLQSRSCREQAGRLESPWSMLWREAYTANERESSPQSYTAHSALSCALSLGQCRILTPQSSTVKPLRGERGQGRATRAPIVVESRAWRAGMYPSLRERHERSSKSVPRPFRFRRH